MAWRRGNDVRTSVLLYPVLLAKPPDEVDTRVLLIVRVGQLRIWLLQAEKAERTIGIRSDADASPCIVTQAEDTRRLIRSAPQLRIRYVFPEIQTNSVPDLLELGGRLEDFEVDISAVPLRVRQT